MKFEDAKKVDVFSLGCIFYYLLSVGQHPFGKESNRDENILKGKASYSHISLRLTEERIAEAEDLVIKMTEKDIRRRPNANDLMNH